MSDKSSTEDISRTNRRQFLKRASGGFLGVPFAANAYEKMNVKSKVFHARGHPDSPISDDKLEKVVDKAFKKIDKWEVDASVISTPGGGNVVEYILYVDSVGNVRQYTADAEEEVTLNKYRKKANEKRQEFRQTDPKTFKQQDTQDAQVAGFAGTSNAQLQPSGFTFLADNQRDHGVDPYGEISNNYEMYILDESEDPKSSRDMLGIRQLFTQRPGNTIDAYSVDGATNWNDFGNYEGEVNHRWSYGGGNPSIHEWDPHSANNGQYSVSVGTGGANIAYSFPKDIPIKSEEETSEEDVNWWWDIGVQGFARDDSIHVEPTSLARVDTSCGSRTYVVRPYAWARFYSPNQWQNIDRAEDGLYDLWHYYNLWFKSC